MSKQTTVEHLVKFNQILGKLETTSSQDLITVNAITQVNEMNIPTAEEFLEDFDYGNQELGNDINYPMVERCMIEFARLHVAAALHEAADNSEIKAVDADMYGVIWEVDVNTILNAYPLTKIK
jgi:hypothetical protein